VRVYIATKNAGKLRELRQILAAYGWEACAFEGYADVVEGETSYPENAALKARALRGALDAAGIADPALGDDSGLEVAALGGRPGVLSARYGGAGATWADRRRLLLADTAAAVTSAPSATVTSAPSATVTSAPSATVTSDSSASVTSDAYRTARAARFVCALHWVPADGPETAVESSFAGFVAHEERGDGGFSYDAIFELNDGRTFAELSESEKNAISHRARAVAALMTALS
jgi:XTP/dITP diphosphohydrolase